MIYPWQTEQWQQLAQAKANNRLAHALLFLGIKGTGKTYFAEYFIRMSLCQKNTSNNCCDTGGCSSLENRDSCHACRLILGKSHPNVLWITPEKEGGVIKIDQVRDAVEFINQSSLENQYRFVIIHPAHQMNTNAANALLKTLEEPSTGAFLILIADQASNLPATIVSRCQRIDFPKPKTELALAWLTRAAEAEAGLTENKNLSPSLALRLSNGAPLAALQFMQNNLFAERAHLLKILSSLNNADPIRSAAEIHAQSLTLIQLLDFTLTWVMDLMRLHTGNPISFDTNQLMNQDFISQLTELRPQTALKNISQFMDYLQALRSQIVMGFNLNKQLIIENILIRWMGCASCS